MRTTHRSALSGAVLAMSAVALLALAGCNTMRGLGQDTQAGGRAVERSAKETQQQLEERQRREREQQQNPGAAPPSSTAPPSA
ncbi:MAG: entericidin A/B family lipoprotein [Alphaproteobacteria bacterium]|nr:entericidin A/B family lipoprotein [Alphaproteobacteria bacterium]